jgi:hypothetical protein
LYFCVSVYFLWGDFWDFFMYDIQHCFICRPSVSTVSEDAGIEPRTVATTALTVRRSNQSARSHPQSTIFIHSRLDLIHSRLDLIHTRLDLIHNRLDLIHNRLDLIHSRLDLIHSRLDLIHTRLDLIHNRLDLIHNRLDLIHNRLDLIQDLMHRRGIIVRGQSYFSRLPKY